MQAHHPRVSMFSSSIRARQLPAKNSSSLTFLVLEPLGTLRSMTCGLVPIWAGHSVLTQRLLLMCKRTTLSHTWLPGPEPKGVMFLCWEVKQCVGLFVCQYELEWNLRQLHRQDDVTVMYRSQTLFWASHRRKSWSDCYQTLFSQMYDSFTSQMFWWQHREEKIWSSMKIYLESSIRDLTHSNHCRSYWTWWLVVIKQLFTCVWQFLDSILKHESSKSDDVFEPIVPFISRTCQG